MAEERSGSSESLRVAPEGGLGVGSRSGRAGTPRAPEGMPGWKRWLLGLDPPALPGVAEVDAAQPQWTQYVEPPPAEGVRWGICCSGGGIRAASFALGGLEALHETGIYQAAAELGDDGRPKGYLAAVSGGGYIAAGHAALRGLTDPNDPSLLADPPPWSATAPETQNLRNHTRYLAPNLSGTVWGLAVIVYGVIRHLLPFAALTVAGGVLYAWLLLAFPHLDLQPHAAQDIDRASVLIAAAVAGGVAVIALGMVALRMLQERTSSSDTLRVVLETWAVRLLLIALAVALLLCAVPLLLRELPRLSAQAQAAVVGANLFSIAVLQRVAHYARTAAMGPWRKRLIAVAAYVLGPLVLVVAVLTVTYAAVMRGPGGTWPWALVCAAYLLLNWVLDDEVHAPLHILYRERLSTAFIRLRVRDGGRLTTAEPSWNVSIDFATLDPVGMPQLVVCAAVNLSDDSVPPGRFAESFTFEKERSGGPATGYVRTSELVAAAGEGVLTLPGMMTIAAAAFSPLMGRSTRPGFRLLMAMFDVRLGMWIPNPRALPGVESARGNPLSRLRGAGKRFAGDDHSLRAPRPYRRPGWSYSLREALGLNRLGLPYLYVTDGGHWENLGLVELMRRGCTRIVCFDASEDSTTLAALGQAMALARDELGVEFVPNEDTTCDLVPGSAKDPADDRLSVDCCARVGFRYPGGVHGVVVIAKNVLPKDAPRDVHAFAAQDARFPTDTTLNQFFDDLHFDAYRTLGHCAGLRAAGMIAP